MFGLFVTLMFLGAIAFFVWLIVVASKKAVRQSKEKAYYKSQLNLNKKSGK